MFDVPGHLPFFLHFERTGRQLVGAYHLVCIARDTSFGFTSTTGTVVVIEYDAVMAAVLMLSTVSMSLWACIRLPPRYERTHATHRMRPTARD